MGSGLEREILSLRPFSAMQETDEDYLHKLCKVEDEQAARDKLRHDFMSATIRPDRQVVRVLSEAGTMCDVGGKMGNFDVDWEFAKRWPPSGVSPGLANSNFSTFLLLTFSEGRHYAQICPSTFAQRQKHCVVIGVQVRAAT